MWNSSTTSTVAQLKCSDTCANASIIDLTKNALQPEDEPEDGTSQKMAREEDANEWTAVACSPFILGYYQQRATSRRPLWQQRNCSSVLFTAQTATTSVHCEFTVYCRRAENMGQFGVRNYESGSNVKTNFHSLDIPDWPMLLAPRSYVQR